MTAAVEVTSYEPISFGSVFPPCRLFSARETKYLFPLSRNDSLQDFDRQTFFKLLEVKMFLRYNDPFCFNRDFTLVILLTLQLTSVTMAQTPSLHHQVQNVDYEAMNISEKMLV